MFRLHDVQFFLRHSVYAAHNTLQEKAAMHKAIHLLMYITKNKLVFTDGTKCTYVASKKVTVTEFFQCKCKKKRCQGQNQR